MAGLEYSEAEALILTFSLNNFLSSDPRSDFVLLWEKHFLKVVQEFQKNHTETYAIAYMAEVMSASVPLLLGSLNPAVGPGKPSCGQGCFQPWEASKGDWGEKCLSAGTIPGSEYSRIPWERHIYYLWFYLNHLCSCPPYDQLWAVPNQK